jgi:hypothetical protein
LRLNQGRSEALVIVRGGQGGKKRNGENFLQEDEVGLTIPNKGMEAIEVSYLVSIEAEDSEERGLSLSILPRERHTAQSSVKAG